MSHSRQSESGLTAIELLVTLFVAAAFLIAGYQLFSVIIKDGGDTRAESRASNIAYDYLRQYVDSASNPCVASQPLPETAINISGLADPKITINITCPQLDAPAISKVTASLAYGSPSKTVEYATYVDKSTGASPSVDVTNGLLAQWKLNGNANASVGSVNGTVYGATPTTNYLLQPNTAYAFNAAVQYQYIEIPSTFNIGNTNVTITLWVNNPTANGNGQYLKIGGPGAGGFAIGLGNGTMGTDSVGPKIIGLFEGNRWIDTGTALGTGWHFIAMSLNSAGIPSFYKDNVSIGAFPFPSNPALEKSQIPAGNAIRIGGEGARFVTGSIDDVRIYNRTLSASELLTLYEQKAQ